MKSTAPQRGEQIDAGALEPIEADSRGTRSARYALLVFVAIEIIAFPILLHLGRYRWFQFDEWDFVAGRTAWNVHDLFAPHAVHWSTLPLLVYRAQWQLWGIRSYVPYQVVSIAAHLVVVALVRAVTRRADVRPWTATAIATLFIFFGAGEENIEWAFQIGFTGALAFGLGHLILADHDGPIDRRDAVGLLAGFAALMCSGVAITMVAVVGLATLLRRGWRIALFHTAPLALAFMVWFAAVGRKNSNGKLGGASTTVAFVWNAITATYHGLTQTHWFGWALAIFIAAGLILAWRVLPAAQLRHVAAAPAALLIGSFAFLVITAVGRSGFENDISRSTRFVYITAAMSLPAIAIAADAFIRRWRVTAVVLLIPLTVSLVGNIRAFSVERPYGWYFQTIRQNIATIPRLPDSAQMPSDVLVEPTITPFVTVGWLRNGLESGRLPTEHVTPQVRANFHLHLTLRDVRATRPAGCRRVVGTAPHLELPKGSSLMLASNGKIAFSENYGGVQSAVVVRDLTTDRKYLAYVTLPDLHVVSLTPDKAFLVCPGH